MAVQETDGKEVNWIIETKGRIWEGTRAKDDAMSSWCRRVSSETGGQWRYIRINQKDVDLSKAVSLGNLVAMVEKPTPQMPIANEYQ